MSSPGLPESSQGSHKIRIVPISAPSATLLARPPRRGRILYSAITRSPALLRRRRHDEHFGYPQQGLHSLEVLYGSGDRDRRCLATSIYGPYY